MQDSEQLLSAGGSEDEGSGLAVIFRGATLGNFLFTQGKPEGSIVISVRRIGDGVSFRREFRRFVAGSLAFDYAKIEMSVVW